MRPFKARAEAPGPLAGPRGPVQVGGMHLIHTLRPVRLGDLAHRVRARTVAAAHATVRWIVTRPAETWVATIMVVALTLFVLVLVTGSTGVGRGGR